MTEHPETPRIAYGDRRADPRTPDPTLRIPLPSPGWDRANRLNRYSRVFLVVAILLAGLFIYLGVRYLLAWLSAQAPYQIPFEQIQLVPPPPEWYRGGTPAFLESVRERTGDSRTISVLGMTPEEIKVMFVRSPWVESVVRVSFPPQSVRVELQYREPVAQINIPGDRRYLLDRSATILPANDVDMERLKQLGPLVLIRGSNLVAPLDPRPGATWKLKAGIADIAEGNRHISSATKLAEFLVKKMRGAGPALSPALEIREVDPTDPDSRGLFMWNGEDTWILWGEAPGEEPPGNLDADEKWAMLRVWNEQTTNRRLPTTEVYWTFSKVGLVRSDRRSKPSMPQKAR